MSDENKRNYQRTKSLNLISYECQDENKDVIAQGMGRTLNVSEGGILLETHIQLQPVSTITLTIGLEDNLVTMNGVIVFSKENETGKIESGIQFIDIDKSGFLFLKKFIKAFQEQKKFLDSMGIKID